MSVYRYIHLTNTDDHPQNQVTTGLGLLLVVFGIGSKMGAIYGTGYNTYYW